MSLTEEPRPKEVKDIEGGPLSTSTTPHSVNQTIEHDYVTAKSFGIRREEILTMQISSGLQLCIYFFTIFIGMFISIIESSCVNVFLSYATNSYKQHSLMSTITVVRSVIAAAALPFYARLSDLFGRTPLFLFAMIMRIVGLVVMSQATNINRYAGGMVIYSLGFAGNRILYQFNLQDASTLKYRLLAVALLSAPVIITTWSSGEVTTSLLNKYDWKFGIALWAFTFPLSSIPYLSFCFYMYYKASKTEAWRQLNEEINISNTGKSLTTRFVTNSKELFWKVDLMGCFLVICFLGLILVPLTLAGGTLKKWKEASIIVPLVLGFVCIPIFCFWEAKCARFPLIPIVLLRDRGVWAAFCIGVFYTLAYNLPSSYSYPVLLVGMNATTTVATRTPQLSLFVASLTLPVLGLVVSRVRRTKGFIIFGTLEWFIAMGLFVHFRGDSNGVNGKYFRNGVAVGMCLLGFGLAFLNRLVSVSAQTCTNHEYMASVTAMFASLYQAGSAVGDCISGAIWTQTMYNKIREKMVSLGLDPKLAASAYASPYTFIKTYQWGTPQRIAVVLAYADVQRNLCIVGLCLCVPLLIFTFFLRDHYLVDQQSLDDFVDDRGIIKSEGKILFIDDDDVILDAMKRVIKRDKKISETENV